MLMFVHLCILLLLKGCEGFGPKCKITLEDTMVDYLDKRYMEVNSAVYDYNSTLRNLAKFTFMFKIDLPDNTMISFSTKKWLRNDYKITILSFQKPLKSMLEMEMFGIQKMCREYSRPPFIWPPKKNVFYRFSGVSIDCSDYPPNLPDGKWLGQEVISFANKTKLVEVSWKMLMEYI